MIIVIIYYICIQIEAFFVNVTELYVTHFADRTCLELVAILPSQLSNC